MADTCIYCRSEGPFRKEHGISALFGEFEHWPKLKNVVCEQCNDRFSKAEIVLGRSTPEAFMRRLLGIRRDERDREDKTFRRGNFKLDPIVFVAYDDLTKRRYLFSVKEHDYTGQIPMPLPVEELNQIVFIDENGDSYPVRIPDGMYDPKQQADAIPFLKDQLRQRTQKRVVNAYITTDDKHWKKATMLVERIIGNGSVRDTHRPRDMDPAMRRITLRFPENAQQHVLRAIAKNAFHFVLQAIPSFRGDETMFSEIRDAIYGRDTIESLVDLVCGDLFVDVDVGAGPRIMNSANVPLRTLAHREPGWQFCHLAFAWWDDRGFFVQLQFFAPRDEASHANLPSWERSHYTVRLSPIPVRKEPANEQVCAYAFLLNDYGKCGSYHGRAVRVV